MQFRGADTPSRFQKSAAVMQELNPDPPAAKRRQDARASIIWLADYAAERAASEQLFAPCSIHRKDGTKPGWSFTVSSDLPQTGSDPIARYVGDGLSTRASWTDAAQTSLDIRSTARWETDLFLDASEMGCTIKSR